MNCPCNPTHYPWFCPVHNVLKTEHWVHLCHTRPDYKEAWDRGEGPGQQVVSISPVERARLKIQKRLTLARGDVGNHLRDVITELGIVMKEGCNCHNIRVTMNRLGTDGCRRERAKLIEKLKLNAKRYSWGDVARAAMSTVKTGLVWKIDLMDPYGSLLDEAIRRAERKDGESDNANSS